MKTAYRKLLPLALALVLALCVAACGGTNPGSGAGSSTSLPSGAPSSDASPSGGASQSASVVDEGGVRTISTVMGDVEVPANPQRVIVHYLMGDVAALGVTPVGVSEVHAGAAFEAAVAGAENLGSWDFDMEAVMALEPDLIITVNEGQYEELSKIAPTVMVPYGTMTTEERVGFVAQVLGREDAGAQVMAEYNAKVAQGRTQLQAAGIEGASVTILQVHDNGTNVAGDKHALGVLVYGELGLVPPEMVQSEIIDADAYWAQPSMEVLADYCGDMIIHLGQMQEVLADNGVWNAIPAVQNGYIMEADTALTYYTDILSSGVLVDTVVEKLTQF